MLYEHTFFDIFPPPHFLAMAPAFGIDLSDRSLRFASLKKDGRNLVLGAFGEEKIPEGIVSAGTIQDQNALAQILSEVREAHDMTFVRISLPEQQSYLVQLELPEVRPDEIRGSIELQLEGMVPIPPEEAVFDYVIIPNKPQKTDATVSVGVSVLPRSIVEHYLSAFRTAGFVPLSCELEAHAIARTVVPRGDYGTYMIVDIGATRTGISIVSKEVVRFTTTLNIGGNLLTNAVARAFSLPEQDARSQKEKEGLTQNTSDGADMFSALMPAVSSLRSEIKRHYLYWHQRNTNDPAAHPGTEPIDRIILCGGEANVPGLREYLSASLNERVITAEPWYNIARLEEYTPEIKQNHALRYVTALGLALRSFE